MEEIFYLTKEGLRRITKEYQELRKIKEEKLKGDFPKILHSEDLDPEYLAFKDDLIFLDSRLSELEYILNHYCLITPPSKDKRDKVQIGATVVLEEDDGSINEFTIVGSLEANPGEGRISYLSPVGKALLGKKVGDEVVITSPIKVTYRIKKIKYQIS